MDYKYNSNLKYFVLPFIGDRGSAKLRGRHFLYLHDLPQTAEAEAKLNQGMVLTP